MPTGRPRTHYEGRRAITIQLSETLIAALDDLAFEEGVTRTAIFERILGSDVDVQRIIARARSAASLLPKEAKGEGDSHE